MIAGGTGENTLETSGKDTKSTPETSGKDTKSTLETSGKDTKSTPVTSGNDIKLRSIQRHTRIECIFGGITPMFQLITHILIYENNKADLKISLLFANQSTHDILLKKELDELQVWFPNVVLLVPSVVLYLLHSFRV
jgi:hypothetical protein